jgi:hypothetical protein
MVHIPVLTALQALRLAAANLVARVWSSARAACVPRLANPRWSLDKALRVAPLPRVTVERHVGLLERRGHAQALKDHFGARP